MPKLSKCCATSGMGSPALSVRPPYTHRAGGRSIMMESCVSAPDRWRVHNGLAG